MAVEQTIQYMKQHLDEWITTEQLANRVGYSTFHFSRIFKDVTGISVRQYLSALRMESGKNELLKHPSLLVKIGMSIGLSSTGTFVTRFKQFVGVSPKRFLSSVEMLFRFVNQYKDRRIDWAMDTNSSLPRVQCRIEAPLSFRGIVYVGLFPRAVPDQKPVAGTAINQNNGTAVISGIPLGTYYLLAAGVPWSRNPRDYFLLHHTLRCKLDEPLHIHETSDLKVTVTLREPLPYDPPIVVNLPLLLFEKIRNNKAK